LKRTLSIALASLCALIACSSSNTTGPQLDGRRVLFIGNSLTYFNDMPFMVRAMAAADGQEPFAPTGVVAPDFSLEDHWNAGEALTAIRRGDWEYVVLQQGPSSLPENQAHLKLWSERFAPEIRAVGARPALYMVWPDASRLFAFDAVSDAYSGAAESVDGLLFPVGEAWRAVWRKDAQAPLYGSDGFHPTAAASYLAAAVIYQQLYNRTPVGLPATLTMLDGSIVSIDAALARTLQEAAVEANAQFARTRPAR
jgi:hypothetical protein